MFRSGDPTFSVVVFARQVREMGLLLEVKCYLQAWFGVLPLISTGIDERWGACLCVVAIVVVVALQSLLWQLSHLS